jgi:hypothetical protein
MNGLIHNDLVISILVVALLTAVGRLVLGVFSVGLEGAAVFVIAGYGVLYLSDLLWRRLRQSPATRKPAPSPPALAPPALAQVVVPAQPATGDDASVGEEAGAGSGPTVQA